MIGREGAEKLLDLEQSMLQTSYVRAMSMLKDVNQLTLSYEDIVPMLKRSNYIIATAIINCTFVRYRNVSLLLKFVELEYRHAVNQNFFEVVFYQFGLSARTSLQNPFASKVLHPNNYIKDTNSSLFPTLVLTNNLHWLLYELTS